MKFQGSETMKAILAAALVSAVLAGCSAGGSAPTDTKNTGGTTAPVAAPTITTTLSSSVVTTAAPATVTSIVKNAAGAGVAGIIVNFSVSSKVGLLSATSALTDSTGKASVLLSPATSSGVGADELTASATVTGTVVSSSVGYQTSAVTATFGTFATDLGADGTHRLSAYGQSDLTLAITGASSAAPATLTLTSDCVSRGKATISPATTTTVTGTATFIYKDSGGCGSVLDADTVSAAITGSSAPPATVKVYLVAPTANSITFDTATPPTIYLKGSGYVESSAVRFKVVDTAGNPLPGQQVVLNLSTFAGGVLLDQQSAAETKTSDASGFVSGIVNSGTVPTPVRVIATLKDTSISTVSSNLAIVTGLPTQLRFSLAQGTINLEGANVDGVKNTYTVLAADRSGNPVPDGTSIIFWSEGGQIQGSASTLVASGIAQATANFVTSSPRPGDGRVTVLAYAIGEESFVDLNGNNVWDAGEPFQDLGDIVKDSQDDGIFDPANDEYVSLNQLNVANNSQTCNDQSAAYPQFAIDASIPNRPGTCDATWSGKTYVRRAVETVFSTSSPELLWAGKSTSVAGEGLDASCGVVSKYLGPPALVTGRTALYSVLLDPTWYTGGQTTGFLSFTVGDENQIRLNPMPAGTQVSVANPTTGLTVAVAGGSVVPNTSDATLSVVSYALAAGTPSGSFTISFTTPGGVKTSYVITVNSASRSAMCAR